MASTVRDLDAALARNVALEVEAAEWKIRAQKAAEEIVELKAQITKEREFGKEVSHELIRLVDSLRTERDDWRTKAEMAR